MAHLPDYISTGSMPKIDQPAHHGHLDISVIKSKFPNILVLPKQQTASMPQIDRPAHDGQLETSVMKFGLPNH